MSTSEEKFHLSEYPPTAHTTPPSTVSSQILYLQPGPKLSSGLASIMNSLFNYWLLFTSLGFTVPFPPCFLSSITCPALTYLPVHLFRAFFTPLPHSSFAQAVNLSAGGRAGVREEVGGWAKLKRKGGCAYMPACWHMCIWLVCLNVSCIWYMFFCLFLQHSLAQCACQQCANMPSPLHAYKRECTATFSPAETRRPHLASSLVTGHMHSHAFERLFHFVWRETRREADNPHWKWMRWEPGPLSALRSWKPPTQSE